MLAATAQAHGRGDFGRVGARAAAAGMAPHARLSELREEAYCKVLRVFVAQQLYNLVRAMRQQSTPATRVPHL
jgi:hypothetical protein